MQSLSTLRRWAQSPALRTGFLLVVLTLLLRIYRITQESVWSDEWFSIILRPDCTFQEFWEINRYRNSDHTPLYYTLVWVWSKVVGTEPLYARYLSVFFGTCNALLLYLLGRKLFSHHAAALGVLLYALSPYHIFQDQNLRPYALLLTLALSSLLMLLRALETGKPRDWLLHGLCNALAVATHPTAVFLFPAEGLFLLMKLGWRPKLLIPWGVVHFAMAGVLPFWMIIPPQDPYFLPINWALLFKNVCGTDVPMTNIEVIVSLDTWPFLPRALADLLRAYRATAGSGLVLFFAIGLGSALVYWVSLLFRTRCEGASPGYRRTAHAMLMLFILIATPALFSVVVSMLREPMPMPRYFFLGSIGKYLVLGFMLSKIFRGSVRKLVVAAVVLLYAYQLSFLLPSTARTQWREANAFVRENRTPDDIVLTVAYVEIGFDIDQAVFRIAQEFGKSAFPPVYRCRTLREVLQLTRCYFKKCVTPGQRGIANVWVLGVKPFDRTPFVPLIDGCHASGFCVERYSYDACEGIQLYRITDCLATRLEFGDVQGFQSSPVRPILENPSTELQEEDKSRAEKMAKFDTWLREAGIEIDPNHRENTLEAMMRVCDAPPRVPQSSGYWVWWSMMFGEEDPALGWQCAEKAIYVDPENADGYLARGICLLQMGKYAEAKDAFRTFLEKPATSYQYVLRRVCRAIIADDMASAKALAQRYYDLGVILPANLVRYFGILTPPDFCNTCP